MANTIREVSSETRETPEYHEGREAFERGFRQSDCPYPRGNHRMSWFTGWLDGRTNKRLGPLLSRYKLTFP